MVWTLTVKIVVGVVVGLVVVGIIVGFVLAVTGSSGSGGGDVPPGQNCDPIETPTPTSVYLAVDRRDFYSTTSTSHGRGRTIDGDLVDENNTVLEKGIVDVVGLSQHPLTYPIGHQFWDSKSFGTVSCNDWTGYTARYSNKACLLSSLIADASTVQSGTGILVIESNKVLGDGGGYEYAPVLLDMDLNVEGLVIRHGGILLALGGKNVDVKSQFILVESGGLFQAGTHRSDSTGKATYRYMDKLTITLTHTAYGYDALGTVASQYGFNVYNPGTTNNAQGVDRNSPFTNSNMPFMNTFGPKVIAVGFNGSLELCGGVPTIQTYDNNWTAHDGDSGASRIGPDNNMYHFDPDTEQEEADKADVATSYPTTWARISNTVVNANDTVIPIAPEDQESVQSWKVGDQIVLTARSRQYTVMGDPAAILPMWMDHDNKEERDANEAANTKFLARYPPTGRPRQFEKDIGPEIATIASIGASEITVATGLHFRHDSTSTSVVSTNPMTGNKTTTVVQTALHIGLLTRHITIRSLLSGEAEGTGANVLVNTFDSPRTPVADEEWSGPGGAVIANAEAPTVSGLPQRHPDPPNGIWHPGDEIFAQCVEGKPRTNPRYSGPETEPAPVGNGSWVHGTATKTGPNSILGGHCNFRYGSSVRVDGVEQRHMGMPANFGSVARYNLHWHLAGQPRHWNGYLRPTTADGVYGKMPVDFSQLSEYDQTTWRRDAIACNGSIVAPFSRWVTIHGTTGVTIRNMVCFVSYGSGMFVEAGIEQSTTFDHNMMVSCLPCIKREYMNSVPLYPNVASDIVIPGFIWVKTNAARITRNVMACAPTGVCGVWAVPQRIAALRFPGSTTMGDSVLKLPGIAGGANVAGDGVRAYLSANTNTYDEMDNKPNDTACWVPEEFYTKLNVSQTGYGCTPMSANNSSTPTHVWADNVFYNILTSTSNFPEYLAEPSPGYDGSAPCFSSTISAGMATGVNVVGWENSAQWLPINGQDACTDSINVAQAPYAQTIWGGGDSRFAYQPIGGLEIKDYGELGITRSQNHFGNIVPIIITNQLTYSMGAAGPLVPGGGWLKQSPVHVYASAFIETSYRIEHDDPHDPPNVNSMQDADEWLMTSTNNVGRPDDTSSPNSPLAVIPSTGYFKSAFSSAMHCSSGGKGNLGYGGIYNIMYDCIFNGGLLLCSNNTIYGGAGALFGDMVHVVNGEFNGYNPDNNYGRHSLNNMFFVDVDTTRFTDAYEMLPTSFWEEREEWINTIGVYDTERTLHWRSTYAGNGAKRIGIAPNFELQKGIVPLHEDTEDWPAQEMLDANTGKQRKLPYLCGNNGKLFRTKDAEGSSVAMADYNVDQWKGIVVNAITRAFVSRKGIALGDRMCSYLHNEVPACWTHWNYYDGTDKATNRPDQMCCLPRDGSCDVAEERPPFS
jgi:hypothetical protein